MTDDRKLTAVEWRLYVVALLAAIYVVTWRVLARPSAGGDVVAESPPSPPAASPPSPPAPEGPPSPTEAESVPAPAVVVAASPAADHAATRSTPQPTLAPRAVWLDQLPARDRPAIVPPAGWIVVDRRAIARPAPRAPAPAPRIERPVMPTTQLGERTPAPVLRQGTPALQRVPGTRRIRRVRTRSS